jgi:hypothetical protein
MIALSLEIEDIEPSKLTVCSLFVRHHVSSYRRRRPALKAAGDAPKPHVRMQPEVSNSGTLFLR